MNENITKLVEQRDIICYAMIEAEGLKWLLLKKQLEQIETFIDRLGDDNVS